MPATYLDESTTWKQIAEHPDVFLFVCIVFADCKVHRSRSLKHLIITNYRNITIACNYKNLIQLLAISLIFSHVLVSQMVQLPGTLREIVDHLVALFQTFTDFACTAIGTYTATINYCMFPHRP